MRAIQICRAYPILDEKMEVVKELGHQLLFTNSTKEELNEWDKSNKDYFRYVIQQKADDENSGETNTVRAFERKYGVQCVWGEVNTGKCKWDCYRIQERTGN